MHKIMGEPVRPRERNEEARMFGLFHDFTVALLQHTALDDILWEIVTGAVSKLDFEDCVVYLWDAEQNVLVQRAAHGPKNPADRTIKDPITIHLGEGVVGSVAKSCKPELVADTLQDQRYIIDDDFRRSELAVPIVHQSQLLGVIDSEHPEPDFYTSEHLEILTMVSSIAAPNIAWAQRTEQLNETLDELTTSESLKRTLIQSAPYGLITLDDQLRVLEWNPAVEEMLGYSARELIGRPLPVKVFALEDEGGFIEQVLSLSGDRSELRVLRHARGAEVRAEVSVVEFQNQGARLIALHLRDVTEYHRTQERLRSSEARFWATFDNASVGIAHLDRDGKWIRVNRKLCDILGFETKAQLLASKLVHQIDEWLRPHWEQDEEVISLEMPCINGVGEAVWISLTLSVIHGRGGSPIYFSLGVEDVTETKKLDALLRETQRMARVGGWEFEIGRHSLIFTREVYDLLDLPLDAHIDANSVETFLSGTARQNFLDSFKRCKRLGLPWDEEYPVLTARGAVRWLRITGQAHQRDGQISRLTGIIQDITRQRSLEEQLRQSQKMEAIGRLAGGIAHDFNNLLTVILGNTSLMLQGIFSPGDEELQQVMDAAERAAALTNQLLVFSRKQMTQPLPVDVNRVLRDMRSMLQRMMGERVRLELNLASDLKPVEIDPNQIEQVVMNLCINARDAMPAGGRLCITSGYRPSSHGGTGDESSGEVFFAVEDSGKGMTKEVQAMVFEPFFSTKKVGEGTGLGLATCYGIVRQAGGGIEVISEPGRGSTFTVWLPESDKPVGETPEPTVTRTISSSATILLVEDEQNVRDLIARVLRDQGYTVLEAACGEEAVSLMGKPLDTPIRLVLCDLVMPGISGVEVAHSIRRTHQNLKILFMTGYSLEARDLLADQELDAPILQKPFLPSEVVGRVAEVLS